MPQFMELQFTLLFAGAFGATAEEFGLTVDATSDAPIARKDDKTVSLLVIENRGIEWQVNSASIGVPFGLNGRDSAGDTAKAIASKKLSAALG